MKPFEVKSSEIKEISNFLIEKKIILHPKISPNGNLDFREYLGKKYIVIIDRNIFVWILKLVEDGHLKDSFKQKVASCLLSWSDLNNIILTGGFALSEYTFFKGNKKSSNIELNSFKQIFKFYHPRDFIDLATNKKQSIPILKIDSNLRETTYKDFNDDHFKMHYLEMIKLAQLYHSSDYTKIEKIRLFFFWNYNNLIICKYTIAFSLLLFGNRSKIFKGKKTIDEIDKVCKNQAWDLTYLSIWSTLYSFENKSNEICLFATGDKELRKIFMYTHNSELNVFYETFGKTKGETVFKLFKNILIPRSKHEIKMSRIDSMIKIEKLKLIEIVESNS